jgi:putative transposase
LVNENDVIVIEDLKVKDMIEGGIRGIAKSFGDAALSKFTNLLEYKSEESGVILHKVNPKGTTQECSKCGIVVPKDITVRVHNCPNCNLLLDRDINAARNILNRGLNDLGDKLTATI